MREELAFVLFLVDACSAAILYAPATTRVCVVKGFTAARRLFFRNLNI